MKVSTRCRRFAIALCAIVGMLTFWGLDGWLSAIHAQSSQPKLVWQMTAEDHYIQGIVSAGSLGRNGSRTILRFTQAIRLNPSHAEAYLERGKAYNQLSSEDDSSKRENKRDAISDFTKAIQLNSNYAEAYFERARTYYSLEEKQQAINDLTQAIQSQFEKS
jgi:tetratricopeptide (TPR) repeat protein